MAYDAKKEWNKSVLGQKGMEYPAEYVIRIFKGSYPRLNLDKASRTGKKICDIGCGDGRNMALLSQCGFEVYGMEITEELCKNAMSNLKSRGIKSDVRAGTNSGIPFDDGFFDYLLSWNSCYYMGGARDFSKHVAEYARVLKKGGTLVLSIPKKTCFIYKGSEDAGNGLRVIRNDPFGVRNGEVLRMFGGEKEIEQAFSPAFGNFTHGSVEDDCFGLDYHWHLTVCRKK